MRYVAGFLFHPQHTGIALIEKQHPEYQKGFLNGIGGKVEAQESPTEAMVREFREETGVHISRWKHFRTERFRHNAPDGGATADVYWYAATARLAEWDELRTTTDEKIVRWSGDINDPLLMYNLKYLIPMAEVLMGVAPEFFPEP